MSTNNHRKDSVKVLDGIGSLFIWQIYAGWNHWAWVLPSWTNNLSNKKNVEGYIVISVYRNSTTKDLKYVQYADWNINQTLIKIGINGISNSIAYSIRPN